MAVPLKFASGQDIPMGYLERLAALRKRKGLTQVDLAERMGVEQPTIQRWERGQREPKFEQLFRLAEILGVDASALLSKDVAVPLGPTLYVKGDVQAGLWRTAIEHPASDWIAFTGRADVSADLEHRFGLRVVGDSMDQVYPEGTILECISLFGRAEASPGKRVIVIRTDIHGDSEATVKELVEQNGELWLVPRSSNPAHMPIKLNSQEPGIVETRIAAIVVASVRPE
ncbi:putative prophage repressor [Novosphingobium aromaticivorans DSM 12444]|uniref:Putative prophage repressor n=1 Tax=Novosphingobium aromaticivorans (strain ATCC 700278 / DSM 12444 / CCUG 56034 / CIP 105152 / NBRC 16084 / F199) TaxID=279238 RepID=Q2G3X3_NOVAD|nr:putative prophage repressor [Novosphingobium aromaticivorans DSM 12444]